MSLIELVVTVVALMLISAASGIMYRLSMEDKNTDAMPEVPFEETADLRR
jgi:hypothetical protein